MVRATKWFGWVECNNGNNGSRLTSYGVNGPTLATAMEDAIKYATFAAGNGHKPSILLTEVCADCDGQGKISRKTRRLYSSKPCKYCRGAGELNRLPEIHFTPHSNTTIHN